MPHRPGATESIVATMRAANGGGIVKTATDGKNRMRLVTAAKAAVKVNASRHSSQCLVTPPQPRSLIIASAKSKPHRSAAIATSRLRS